MDAVCQVVAGIRITPVVAGTGTIDGGDAIGRVIADAEALRKTLTYGQGKEMTYHDALTLRTGVKVYFADPHSPWQPGSNENINGLLRQYLPKDTDLSVYIQKELDDIVLSLNTRPRKRHNFRTPLEVYNEFLDLAETKIGTMH